MWDKIKAALAWLYNWVTVIGAVVVGGASVALPHIETLGLINFGAFIPAETALKIVTGIAVIKWCCVLVTTFAASREVDG